MAEPIKQPKQYDVCLSFTGEDRAYVELLARMLVERGVRVFYDEYEQAALWGKDLYTHLEFVYRDAARYCVVFISEHYARRLWATHELRVAQSRAFESAREYILPARFDDTQIPGVLPTTAYIDLTKVDPGALADIISRKLEPSDGREVEMASNAIATNITIELDCGSATFSSLHGFAVRSQGSIMADLAQQSATRLISQSIQDGPHAWWTHPPDRQFDRVYATSGVLETTTTLGPGLHTALEKRALHYLRSLDLSSVDNRAAAFTLLGLDRYPAAAASELLQALDEQQIANGADDDGSFLFTQGPLIGGPSQWTPRLHTGGQSFHACHISELLLRLSARHPETSNKSLPIIQRLRSYIVRMLRNNDGWLLNIDGSLSDMTLYAYAVLPALRAPLPPSWMENSRIILAEISLHSSSPMAWCRTLVNSLIITRQGIASEFARLAEKFSPRLIGKVIEWAMDKSRSPVELAFALRASVYGLEIVNPAASFTLRANLSRELITQEIHRQ